MRSFEKMVFEVVRIELFFNERTVNYNDFSSVFRSIRAFFTRIGPISPSFRPESDVISTVIESSRRKIRRVFAFIEHVQDHIEDTFVVHLTTESILHERKYGKIEDVRVVNVLRL